MFKKLLIAIVAAVVAFAGYVALQPGEFNVVRETTIAASPATVFAHVNDLKKWGAWSPWAKLDPDAKMTFDGPAEGKGAGAAWSGNDKVGEGKMTIVESKPNDSVGIKLDFVRPMPGSRDVAFTFKPEGAGTKVIWGMSGTQSFIERAACIIMGVNMDKMIGSDYERGLASLKSVAEKG